MITVHAFPTDTENDVSSISPASFALTRSLLKDGGAYFELEGGGAHK